VDYDALVQYELEKEEKRDRYYREDKGLEKDYDYGYDYIKVRSTAGTGRDQDIMVVWRGDWRKERDVAPIVIRPNFFAGDIKTTEDESSLTPMEQRLVQTKRKIQL